MRTSPSSRIDKSRAHARAGMRGKSRVDMAGAADEDLEAAVLRLTQDQMLVNQALVEKIFACERAERALHDSEQQLHELLAHQLHVREAERKRLSEEIHDAVGQNLLALRLDIATLHRWTADRHPRLHERAEAALDTIDTSLRTVRKLLSDLRPSCLELGLRDTIRFELNKFMRTSGILCELTDGNDVAILVLDEDLVLLACRVLQECLNNVARHSLASRVHVALTHESGFVTLAICDNGIGFDRTAPRQPGSFGLIGLKESVTGRGGVLDIESSRSAGTCVSATLPVVPPKARLVHEAAIG